MKHKLLQIVLISALCFMHTLVHSQHDNVWAFGQYGGIDFNTNPATTFKSSMSTMEGVASICDENGVLQFYTDGYNVYDRQHNKMSPLGISDGLVDRRFLDGYGTASTSQGTIIIPMPGDSNKYYIFSLLSWECGPDFGKLFYSTVDMTKNGGLGSIVEKGILLDSMFTEHMTAVSGNDCNVWLVLLSRKNNAFKSFNIDVNGISHTPVLSPGGIPIDWNDYYQACGTIDISPDRSKLAIAYEKIVLYDFDINIGAISNPLILDTFVMPSDILRWEDGRLFGFSLFYGISFSPDNSKLFYTLPDMPRRSDHSYYTWKSGLYQYDISLADSNMIRNSKIRLSTEKIWALRRAPDGKIYGAILGDAIGPAVGTNHLSVIHRPDLAGTACQFEDTAFTLFPMTFSRIGLPNTGTIFTYRKVYSTTTDSSYCSNRRTLTPKFLNGMDYIWSDGRTTTIHETDTAGTFWVKYKVPINSPCKYEIHIDTFKVIFALTTQNRTTIITDSGMCKADTVHLLASTLHATNYIWEDGSTGYHRIVNKAGEYILTYQVDSLCELYKDQFIVHYPDKDYQVDFLADSIVCINEAVSLRNQSDNHYRNFSWSFGDGGISTADNPVYTYRQSGNFDVILTANINELCSDTAIHTIVVDAIQAVIFDIEPEQSICVGERIHIRHKIPNETVQYIHWNYGDGNTNHTSTQQIQHTFDQSGTFTILLTAVFRACPESIYTKQVTVHSLPLVDIGSDSGLCLDGRPLTLSNKYQYGEGYSYLWSTGEQTSSIQVKHHGAYWLRVSNAFGCSTEEKIAVTKDCYAYIPNAFTPNGDGVNDYFFPRQLLSKGIASFQMQIFDRWGQKIFETTNSNGRGWDGTYNGQHQQNGVYLYLIQIEFSNGHQERYEGNVTLIR